jgi:hypothetical protein
MRLKKAYGIFGVITLLLFSPAGAFAAAGDGTATISPTDDVVAGSLGTWTFTYTATDTFISGQVQLTIPDGWTAPQNTVNTSPGYVTITSSGSLGTIDITGQVITIDVTELDTLGTVTIVYGADPPPTGRAQADTVAASGVEFTVRDKPTVPEVLTEIASSPTLNIIANTPSLYVTPNDTTATAGDYPLFRLYLEDDYGNPSPAQADRTIQLTAERGGYYSKDDSTTISQIVIPSGGTSAEFRYMDTLMNMDPAENPHKYWLNFNDIDGLSPPLIATDSIWIDHAEPDTCRIRTHVDELMVNDFTSPDSINIYVEIHDVYGNNVDSALVYLKVGGDSNHVAPSDTVVSGFRPDWPVWMFGFAQFKLRSKKAEEKFLTCDVEGVHIADTAFVTFTPGPLVPDSCLIASNLDTVIADGVDEAEITVTVVDRFDNPISGQTVTLFANDADITQPGELTGADGTAQGTIRSTISGIKTVKARVGIEDIADSVVVYFKAGSVDPLTSTLDLSDDTVTADGVDSVTVTVVLMDEYGNPVPGQQVQLEATDTNGGNTISPAGLTDNNGEYVGTIKSTYAEMKTVQALVNGSFYVFETADVLFEAGPVSLTVSEIAIDKATVIADGTDAVAVTVTARDAFGNPVSGSTVTIDATDTNSGNSITQPVGVTGSSGELTGYIRSTYAELKTVTAEIDLVQIVPTESVQFVAGDPDYFIITHDGSAIAGSDTSVTIDVRDAYDNRDLDFTGTVLLYTDTPETGDFITWGLGTGTGIINNIAGDEATYQFGVGDNGIATLEITDEKAESIYLSADYLTVSSTSASPLVVGHATADSIYIVDGDGQTAQAATNVPNLPLRVGVNDTYGNPVSGATVDFSIISGVNAYIDTDDGTPGQQTAAVTDASGVAECDIWQLGETAAPNSDEILADISMGSSPTVSFTATATPGDPATLALNFQSPPPWGITINQFRTIIATLRDGFNNLVTGEKVRIYISDFSDGYLSADLGNPNPTDSLGTSIREGTTDATGTISVRYNAPATAGLSDIIDASHDLVPGSSVQDAEFVSVASGATTLRVTNLSTGTVEADVTFSFDVEAVDNEGNVDLSNTSLIDLDPPAGGGFTFSLTDFGAPITQVDLVNGARTIYGRADTTGDWQVDISDNAAVLSPTFFDISIVASTLIDHYDVTASGSVVAGDDIGLSVIAKDAFNNTVTSASRSLTLTAVQAADSSLAASDTLSFSSAPLENGTYTSSGLFYRTAEIIRVEVSDGSAIGYSGPIAVDHAGAYRVAKISGDTTGVWAGDSVSLDTRVYDVYGNTVDGENVTFTRQEGLGGPTPEIIMTDGAGRVSFRYGTGTTVGFNSVRAAILEGDDEGIETQIFGMTTIPRPTIDYVELDLDGFAFTAGETFEGRVAAYDQYNNLIYTDNTSQLVPGDSTGTMSFVPPSLTLTAGRDTFEASDTAMGVNRIAILSLASDTLALSPPITIDHGPAYQIAKVSGDTLGVLVGNTITLWVRVYDEYGNPVDGENCYFAVDSDPGGNSSLLDGSGTDVARIVQTDGSGNATCRLVTDTEPGDNVVNVSILDGPPPAREGVQFTVSTFTGAIVRYDVIPDGLQKTAGESFTVEIIGYDTEDNIAIDDNTTRVDLGSDGSATFDSTTVTLSAGRATVTVQDTVAELLTINAQTEGGGAVGTSDAITIDPDVPWGAIGIQSVSPDTITANGTSRSLITTSEITDQYGNRVATGTYVTISTSLGSVDSEDQDGSTAGIQRATNANGEVQTYIRSGTTTGTASIGFVSVEGSGVGTTSIYFEPPPAIVYGGYLDPPYAAPAEDLSLVCTVTNTSVTGLYIDASNTIFFEDGAGHEFRAALQSDVFIDGLETDTLRFVPTELDTYFVGGTYTPVVTADGTDIYGSEYTVTFNAGSNSIAVSHVEITGITAPAVVSRGDIVPVTVSIRNAGGNDITVTDIALDIDFGSYTYPAVWSPALPDILVPGQTRDYTGDVTVQPGSALGIATIDASVLAQANGHTIGDPSAQGNVATWTVQSAASISDIPGTLDPSTVTSGHAYAFSVDLRNNGQAAVILDTLNTQLTFTDGIRVYSAQVKPGGALPGNAVSTLDFKESDVSDLFTAGAYAVTVAIAGTENGGPFNDVLVLSDNVIVQAPAQIAYRGGTVSPGSVNRRSTISFEVGVTNSGGTTVGCNPDSTWITFDDGSTFYNALLDVDRVAHIEPGDTTLFFRSEEIPDTIATGGYLADVQIIGLENGHRHETTLALIDAIQVQEPSELTINSIALSLLDDRITADQSASFTATVAVQNNGQSPVRLDDIWLNLFIGTLEVTGEYIINPAFIPGADILNEGEQRNIDITLSDNPANAMSTGTVIIEASVQGWDLTGEEDVFAQSGLGVSRDFLVQTPADPVIVDIIPSVDRASVEQTRDWYVDVVVRNDGESNIGVTLIPPSMIIDFSTSGDFLIENPASLEGGGAILEGGETDMLRFRIDRTGTVAGSSDISAQVAGVEINSGRPVIANGMSPSAVEIQSKGELDITSVIPSQDPVTVGQQQEWTVAVSIANIGGADVTLRLDNSDSTYASIPAGSGFTITPPTELQEGGTNLPGGSSGTLIFTVTATGTVAPGSQTIQAAVVGDDDNSGNPVWTGAVSGNVIFETKPAIQYAGNLSPIVVSRGTDISIQLDVSSTDPAHSTLLLDYENTEAFFGDADGDTFRVSLFEGSAGTIPGGTTQTLQFSSGAIGTGIDIGSYPVSIHLEGIENDNPFTQDIDSTPDVISVQEAPDLSITSIEVPSTVTANQDLDYDIRMNLVNSGEANVVIDFDILKTKISFVDLGETDRTAEYSITYPGSLETAGDDTLAGGASDVLVFTVTRTGFSTGTMLVHGDVVATDVNSGLELSDNTLSGGWGLMDVQAPGAPVISQIVASRATVTSNQATDWNVTVTARNDGEAILTLDMGSTYIFTDAPYTLQFTSPDYFTDGDSILAAGESRDLRFAVTQTPDIQGGFDLPLEGHIEMVENNSLETRAFDTESAGSGSGNIRVQAPAALRILAVDNAAFNAPYVNTDQDFPVAFSIENTGEARADSIYISLGSSSSMVNNTPIVLDGLDGTDSVSDTFFVTAANSPGADVFAANIDSAIDANSRQDDLVATLPPVDDTAGATIQSPSDLSVTAVTPSQAEVNADQRREWTIRVDLQNNGSAPAALDMPEDNDIEFFLSGQQQLDYRVVAPDTFASGLPVTGIAGGGSEALIYTVTRTGSATGTIDITADIAWDDINDPARTTADAAGNSWVIVTPPSGLRITAISSNAPNSDDQTSTSTVNTGQFFDLTITVSNTGGDNIDSVFVAITSTGNSTPTLSGLNDRSIPAAGTEDFVFNIEAAPDPGFEVLTAEIIYAVSENTGEEVTPAPPLESIENVRVQQPASLSVNAQITNPDGATDGIVSAGQTFDIIALVTNASPDAQVSSDGQLTLTLWGDFGDVVPDVLTRVFQPGTSLVWTITAPLTVGLDSLSVAITQTPTDINTGSGAVVTQVEERMNIETEAAASLGNFTAAIIAPAGATDNTLSTDQEFTVEARIAPSPNSEDVWLRLEVLPGFSVADIDSIQLTGIDGNEKTHTWSVTAPTLETSGALLRVHARGADSNTGLSITSDRADIIADVVTKAVLDLTSADIISPLEAVDGDIPASVVFAVSALVGKTGAAAVDTTGARLTIELPDDQGYALETGETDSKGFEPGTSVEWEIRSPDVPTLTGNIRVFIEVPVRDENTDTFAVVNTSERFIAVKTQAGSITMTNVSTEGEIPPYVAPQAAVDVPVIRAAFQNESLSPVGLDAVRVTIKDGNGNIIRNPSSRVSVVRLLAGGGPYETDTRGITGPVVIDVGHNYTLGASAGDTVLVEVDIAGSAPAGEMRIEIAESNDIIFTTAEGGRVPVTSVGGGDIAGNFLSGPLSVMSSNFEEYVHNYPNPFRAGSEPTKITYFLTENASVKIQIWDLMGSLVWTKDIAAGETGGTGEAGGTTHEVEWDGRNSNGDVVRNGVYICKLQAGSRTATFKIAVAK